MEACGVSQWIWAPPGRVLAWSLRLYSGESEESSGPRKGAAGGQEQWNVQHVQVLQMAMCSSVHLHVYCDAIVG